MHRRLISTEAAAAWNSRITRQITPARNAELIDYQKNVKTVRQQYQQERKGLPTKSEIEAIRKAKNRHESIARWDSRMAETKSKVEQIVKESTGQNLTQKHHPCRPTILHTKTAEEREANGARLAEALRPAMIMRRKYLRLLADSQPQWVTRENLMSKIEHAIAHPTNYDLFVDREVDVEMAVRAKLRETRVPDDTGNM
jgi:hypothetical protein